MCQRASYSNRTYYEIHTKEHKVVHTAIPVNDPPEALEVFQKYMHEHPFLAYAE
ncbi:MAG: hypothetical protein HZA01_16680 [Nitrospinae bacterium]|nr:hypothetical protein [Nitrospinota bacterium]